MEWNKFLIEYIKSPRTIGAIAPSSKNLSDKMVGSVNFENASCIIEYGPGTGVFTEKLIRNKKEHTKLIIIEYNEEFFKNLKNKYDGISNVIVVNDSAENVDKYLHKYNIKEVDYIVSGLPFASLPKSVSNKILRETKNVLKKNGLFVTFQYTKLKKKCFECYFQQIIWEKVLLNLPPAYILKCRNTL